MKIVRMLVGAAMVLSSARVGAQGSIVGTVYDSMSMRAPMAHATVVLVERSRYATTDARGRFRFDSVPDGHYTLGLLHPLLDSLDLQLPVVPVEVADGRRVTVALSTPSAATAYARICPDVRETDTGVIIGRVRDVDDGSPVADATVSTAWTEFTVAGGRRDARRERAAARSNPTGIYLLCSVPIGVPLDVRTELTGVVAGPTPVRLDDRLISRADFALSRRDSAARVVARVVARGDSSTFPTPPAGTATLRGVVRGANGRPVRDAVVGIVGTGRSVRTDSTGAFRIDRIPAGTRTIDVRSIGSPPSTFSIDFATKAVRDSTLTVGRQAQELAPVAVVGHGTSTSLMETDGFEVRRRQGMGAFMTAQDLARYALPDLTQVLIGMRGVHIEYNTSTYASGRPMPYMRGIADLQGSYCVPNVFLDGAPFAIASGIGIGRVPDPSRFSELTSMVRPEVIRGIEVYSSAGAIPPQYDYYSSTGCGSVVIWTR